MISVRPALMLLLHIIAGLGGCDDTTGRTRVGFTLRAGGLSRDAARPLTLTTVSGWQVELTEARVALGPLYLNVAPPLDEGAARRPRRRWLPSAVLVAEAHAGEGQDHLAGGRVIGQVLNRRVVDALSPDLVDLGPGEGVSERGLSAELWLVPDALPGMGDELPDKSVACARGVARRDADELRFVACLRLDASLAAGQPLQTLRAVRRIPADIPLSEGGGVVTLRVDPRPWLAGADFADLKTYPPSQDGSLAARPTDTVGRSLLQGVRQIRGVYLFSFQPWDGT